MSFLSRSLGAFRRPPPEAWLVSGLFLLVVWLHASSPMLNAPDARWAVHVAMSLLHEGDLDLDEYPVAHSQGYALETVNGHRYSMYPVGGPLLAAPLVWLVDVGGRYGLGYDLGALLQRDTPIQLSCFLASVLVAITCVVFYFVARSQLGPFGSLAAALMLGFSTSAWSTASRGLWQHGPSMLALTVALWALTRVKERPWTLGLAGAAIAFSYVCRPTNFVAVLAFTGYVALARRRDLWRYLAGAALVALPFVGSNLSIYGFPLPNYYRPQAINALAQSVAGTQSSFFVALAGHLVSPGRGLFLFSPVLLFSIVGTWLAVRRNRRDGFLWTVLAAVVAHWLVISFFAMWWAGHSFGPRLFTDMLPFFLWLLLPALAHASQLAGARRLVWVGAVGALALFSAFVHFRGAHHPAVVLWNLEPDNIDWEGRHRLWDFTDIQYLRGL